MLPESWSMEREVYTCHAHRPAFFFFYEWHDLAAFILEFPGKRGDALVNQIQV
jgi:hypothetical protein